MLTRITIQRRWGKTAAGGGDRRCELPLPSRSFIFHMMGQTTVATNPSKVSRKA